ncbi:hypothetical protein BDU57DRAFT_203872 [Ampelomyces quisqualis]|uniref:Uncharacterized protein n=1 Tax=Ampelomyces quisqualis TaxID=50730 RepID=A0A6A5QT25_AMPQU|nr:hypothetical protein BDU57DRAFT_203872 [Ampelomyces quisqualis]
MTSQELADKVQDLTLQPSHVETELQRYKRKYTKLLSDYKQLKQNHEELEDEHGQMDDYNRELEAEVKNLELQNEGLQEEVDELRQAASNPVNDNMTTREVETANTSVMAMEGIETEQEEASKLCPFWQVGPCRLAGPGNWCKNGYHPPKERKPRNNKVDRSSFASAA